MTCMPLGWLSPNGDFCECSYYEHTATAEEIIAQLNLSYDENIYYAPDDFLLSKGWVKLGLSSLGNKEYWIHWERKMTESQKSYCKVYFESDDLKFPMNIVSIGMWKYEDDFFEKRY